MSLYNKRGCDEIIQQFIEGLDIELNRTFQS